MSNFWSPWLRYRINKQELYERARDLLELPTHSEQDEQNKTEEDIINDLITVWRNDRNSKVVMKLLLHSILISWSHGRARKYYSDYPTLKESYPFADFHSIVQNILIDILFTQNEILKYDIEKGNIYQFLNTTIVFALKKELSKEFGIEIGQRSDIGTFKNLPNYQVKEMLGYDDNLIKFYNKIQEYVKGQEARRFNDIDWSYFLDENPNLNQEKLQEKFNYIRELYIRYKKIISLNNKIKKDEDSDKPDEIIDTISEDNETKIRRENREKEGEKYEQYKEYIKRLLHEEDNKREYYYYYLMVIFESDNQEYLAEIFQVDQSTISRHKDRLKDKCLYHLSKEFSDGARPLIFKDFEKELSDERKNTLNQKIKEIAKNISNSSSEEQDNLQSVIKDKIIPNIISKFYNENSYSVIVSPYKEDKIERKQVINSLVQSTIEKINESFQTSKICSDDPSYLNYIKYFIEKEVFDKILLYIDRKIVGDYLYNSVAEEANPEIYSFYQEQLQNTPNISKEVLKKNLFTFLNEKLSNISLEADINNLYNANDQAIRDKVTNFDLVEKLKSDGFIGS